MPFCDPHRGDQSFRLPLPLYNLVMGLPFDARYLSTRWENWFEDSSAANLAWWPEIFLNSSPRFVVLALCSVHVVLQMQVSAYVCSHLSDSVAAVRRFSSCWSIFLTTPVLHSFKGDPSCQGASYDMHEKSRTPFRTKTVLSLLKAKLWRLLSLFGRPHLPGDLKTAVGGHAQRWKSFLSTSFISPAVSGQINPDCDWL
jgi:hypothetical protein